VSLCPPKPTSTAAIEVLSLFCRLLLLLLLHHLLLILRRRLFLLLLLLLPQSQ
jgi:hypothetical protein